MKEATPKKIESEFFRIVAFIHRDVILSMEGSLLYGGRFNPKEDFGALYASETREVCVEERKRTGVVRGKPQAVATLFVSLDRVLDLTDPETLEQFRISTEDLVQSDFTLTQEIARQARNAGFEAILAPSATRLGKNLVIFMDRLSDTSFVTIENIAEISID